MSAPRIASREEWLQARKALLEEEKAFTRQKDALAQKRQALPWVEVSEAYRFTGPDGEVGLAELFGEQRQLALYHFMFGPDWEKPCPSCSLWAESFDSYPWHLADRDVRLVAVSRAPLEKLQTWAQKAGWRFPWYSSLGSRFNYDFGVSFEEGAEGQSYNYLARDSLSGEMPGFSAFVRDEDGRIFHTYSAFARGLEPLNNLYGVLDLMPRGRDEGSLPWPMAWVKRRAEAE